MIYVSFLELEEHYHENRIVFRSSLGVIDYMAQVLGRLAPVLLLSPIRTANQSGYIKGRTQPYTDKITLKVPSTFGCKTKLGRFLVVAWTQLWLLINLLIHAKKGQPVVVYHSLSIMGTVRLAKALKGFRLIEEVREVYADVYNHAAIRKREARFFAAADAYIFATQVLNGSINTQSKPYAIAAGVYLPAPTVEPQALDPSKIHVVYAGTFTIAKGGALMAIKATEFLPDRYHVHILGKGSDEELQAVLSEIERVQKGSSATLTYDGCLMGKAFRSFLQGCHIGLSTQDISGDFNATSFPSKILTYLSNGLPVVTGRIAAVETSGVNPFVTYYDDNDPRSIAAAILHIGNGSADVRQGLLQLDHELENALHTLLCEP